MEDEVVTYTHKPRLRSEWQADDMIDAGMGYFTLAAVLMGPPLIVFVIWKLAM